MDAQPPQHWCRELHEMDRVLMATFWTTSPLLHDLKWFCDNFGLHMDTRTWSLNDYERCKAVLDEVSSQPQGPRTCGAIAAVLRGMRRTKEAEMACAICKDVPHGSLTRVRIPNLKDHKRAAGKKIRRTQRKWTWRGLGFVCIALGYVAAFLVGRYVLPIQPESSTVRFPDPDDRLHPEDVHRSAQNSSAVEQHSSPFSFPPPAQQAGATPPPLPPETKPAGIWLQAEVDDPLNMPPRSCRAVPFQNFDVTFKLDASEIWPGSLRNIASCASTHQLQDKVTLTGASRLDKVRTITRDISPAVGTLRLSDMDTRNSNKACSLPAKDALTLPNLTDLEFHLLNLSSSGCLFECFGSPNLHLPRLKRIALLSTDVTAINVGALRILLSKVAPNLEILELDNIKSGSNPETSILTAGMCGSGFRIKTDGDRHRNPDYRYATNHIRAIAACEPLIYY